MTIDQYKDLLLEDELKIGVGVPEDEFTDEFDDAFNGQFYISSYVYF